MNKKQLQQHYLALVANHFIVEEKPLGFTSFMNTGRRIAMYRNENGCHCAIGLVLKDLGLPKNDPMWKSERNIDYHIHTDRLFDEGSVSARLLFNLSQKIDLSFLRRLQDSHDNACCKGNPPHQRHILSRNLLRLSEGFNLTWHTQWEVSNPFSC